MLSTQELAFYTVLLLNVLLVIFIVYKEVRFGKFFRYKNSKNKTIEHTLDTILEHYALMSEHHQKIVRDHKNLLTKNKQSIRGIGLVRFNPFTETSANQSFAFALVNEHGDGMVVSSLYARESMRVYAKPIKQFASEHELTVEEKKALDQAINYQL